MPKELDNELLKKYMTGRDTVYLLFQTGTLFSYHFPRNGTELDFDDFHMKLIYGTSPKAFFNAGEDYALFELTRKRPDAPAGSENINGKEEP